jgi:hypothetical protein
MDKRMCHDPWRKKYIAFVSDTPTPILINFFWIAAIKKRPAMAPTTSSRYFRKFAFQGSHSGTGTDVMIF